MENNLERDCPCGKCKFWYDTLDKVDEFHRKFKIGAYDTSKDYNRKEAGNRRILLLQEEMKELIEALKAFLIIDTRPGLVVSKKKLKSNILKELCDLQYVLDGTLIELDLDKYFDEAFLRVHESNMSKLDKDGNPIKNEYGKILKSKNYKSPDLKSLFLEKDFF